MLLVHVSALQQEIGHVVSEPRCMYAQFVDVFDRLPAVSQQVAQMTMRGTHHGARACTKLVIQIIMTFFLVAFTNFKLNMIN